MKQWYTWQIAELCSDHIINFVDIEKNTGINRNTLTRMKNRSNKLRASTIRRIAEYLDLEVSSDDQGIYWYKPKIKFQASDLYAEDAKVTYKQLELLEYLDELNINNKEDCQKMMEIFFDQQGKFSQEIFNALLTLCKRRRV